MKRMYESPELEIEKFTIRCDNTLSDGAGIGAGGDEYEGDDF